VYFFVDEDLMGMLSVGLREGNEFWGRQVRVKGGRVKSNKCKEGTEKIFGKFLGETML
jgi:hypothetical protein